MHACIIIDAALEHNFVSKFSYHHSMIINILVVIISMIVSIQLQCSAWIPAKDLRDWFALI